MSTEKVKYELTLRDQMTKGLGDINSKLGQLEGKLSSVEKKTEGMSSGVGGALKGFISIAAVTKLASFGNEIIQTTARFQSLSNSIKFASDTAVQGESSMLWISDLSRKMGLPIEETTEGFKTLQGALMKTKFTSADTRNMFRQVSTGIVAMGLSADDAKGVFLALGQIMGKGKVSAEELRGQIGERVPGAFAIAARAIGVTTAELDKMMKDGKLISEDFLPKFAAEMEKTFGAGAEKNANGLSASLNRISNAWTEMMVSIGNSDKDGLISKTLNGLSSGIDAIGDSFKSFDQKNREAINPALIRYLDDVDARQKKLRDTMGGKSAKEKSKSFEAQRDEELMWLDKGLSKNQRDINQALSDMGMSGANKEQIDRAGDKVGYSSHTRSMNIEGKAKYDNALARLRSFSENRILLEEEKKGISQSYDKTISDIFGDTGIFTKPSQGSKTDKELNDASSSVSGSAPKVTNINIEALMKDTKITNIFDSSGKLTIDGKNFLELLKNALGTVVTDTYLIQH